MEAKRRPKLTRRPKLSFFQKALQMADTVQRQEVAPIVPGPGRDTRALQAAPHAPGLGLNEAYAFPCRRKWSGYSRFGRHGKQDGARTAA